MSPAYVLILLLTAYGSDGGNALTTAPFPTLEACERVGQAAKEMPSNSRHINYRCVSAR
ncbi:hypothetical protein [Methylobacterium soli]|uniref:hypothetical protein n=1 Tax=Methylobacterium soli TaxID=553447 RepID=UPI0017832F85|nr:hypothetical protein [Methylobacterium soli]GJE43970.1 hypothetical protein AEGHOMDF_3156 [Methylobacterium soli]